MSVWLRGLGAIAIAGCHVSDVDLTGKACPCAIGWQCDSSTNTCTRGGADAQDASMLDNNLQFWFRLDETDGTVAHDSSGHNGDGTLDLAHATWMPSSGKLAGALHLDGTPYKACVSFPTPCPTPSPTFSTALTVSGWVNFDKLTPLVVYSLGDFAVVQGTSGGMQGAWGIGATDKCTSASGAGETLGFTVTPETNSTTRVIRCSTTRVVTGTWYHVTAVYDGPAGRQDIYVDGVKDNGTLVGTTPAALFHPPGCPKLACPSNQTSLMAGILDEIRIYDRALTDAEAAALFTASGG